MHESMMIAEVGFIENVSGRRIATPFAPPSPGSTPMITPSVIPTIISMRLYGVRATENPCSSALIFSMSPDSVQAEGRFEGAFRQRHLEPDLEHQEEGDAHADADRDVLHPRVLSQP